MSIFGKSPADSERDRKIDLCWQAANNNAKAIQGLFDQLSRLVELQKCAACQGTGQVGRPGIGGVIDCHACGGKGS